MYGCFGSTTKLGVSICIGDGCCGRREDIEFSAEGLRVNLWLNYAPVLDNWWFAFSSFAVRKLFQEYSWFRNYFMGYFNWFYKSFLIFRSGFGRLITKHEIINPKVMGSLRYEVNSQFHWNQTKSVKSRNHSNQVFRFFEIIGKVTLKSVEINEINWCQWVLNPKLHAWFGK